MAEEKDDPVALSVPRARRSVVVALVLIFGQAVFVPMLLSGVLEVAYSFAGSKVGSIDELYKLGDGAKSAAVSAVGMAFIGGTVGLVLLISARTRGWAWLAPAVAMAVSIALCMYFVSTFHMPAPTIGG